MGVPYPDVFPYIQRAVDELSVKSLADIQIETALTWAGRACAASHIGRLADAVEYAHEAIEHAALSGHDTLLQQIRSALEKYGIPLFHQRD